MPFPAWGGSASVAPIAFSHFEIGGIGQGDVPYSAREFTHSASKFAHFSDFSADFAKLERSLSQLARRFADVSTPSGMLSPPGPARVAPMSELISAQ